MSPRTKQQNEEIRAQSRTKILMAALEVFAENGYPNTSISQIAKKAGIAKGSLYHYFESKEAILEAVILNGLSEFDGMMEAVVTKQQPDEQFKLLINMSFDSILERKEFWKLYFSLLTQLNLPKALANKFNPILLEMFEFMTQLLQRLGIENAAIEAKILGASIDGAFMHYLMLEDAYPLEKVREALINKYINT